MKLLDKIIGFFKSAVEASKKFVIEYVEPTWWYQQCQAYNRQRACNHLKGAGRGPKSRSDYNVSLHTFSDGWSRIKCLNHCGWEVWNKPGWSYKWQHGMKMVNQSSNWPSSSQVLKQFWKGPIEGLKKPLAVDPAVYFDFSSLSREEEIEENPIRGRSK